MLKKISIIFIFTAAVLGIPNPAMAAGNCPSGAACSATMPTTPKVNPTPAPVAPVATPTTAATKPAVPTPVVTPATVPAPVVPTPVVTPAIVPAPVVPTPVVTPAVVPAPVVPTPVVTPAAVPTPVVTPAAVPTPVVTPAPTLAMQSTTTTPVVIVKNVPGPKQVITKTIIREVPAATTADVLPQYASVGNNNNSPDYTSTIIAIVVVWFLTGIYHKRKETNL